MMTYEIFSGNENAPSSPKSLNSYCGMLLNEPKLIISYIGFSGDLSKAYLYLYNEGIHPISLTSISLNGEDVTSSSDLKNVDLAPKERSLAIIRPRTVFKVGTFQTFTVRTSEGDVEANVRVIQPFFPVGMYGGDAAFSSREGIQALISWGIDTIVADPKLCDEALSKGFKVIATGPVRNEKEKYSIDIEKIERYKDHPSLLAWYVVDEPDIWELSGNIPKGATQEWTDGIRKIDGRNPTYVVLCRPPIFEMFSGIPDILAVDPYPVTHLPLDYVSYMTNRIREASKPKPIWVIPQAFRFARPTSEGRWPWPRYPTPEEERLMTYMALAHGAKGIVYFVYNSWVDYPRDPVQGLAYDSTATLALREEITKLSVELHVVGPLLVNSDVTDWAFSNSGAIDTSAVLCGEDTIALFAINKNYVSTNEDFIINPVKKVQLRVKVPKWMELNEAFGISHKGLERVDLTSDWWIPSHWENAWCQKTREGVNIYYPEIATTKLLILTSNSKLYNQLVESWYQWRR
jgi:hypothetical protein